MSNKLDNLVSSITNFQFKKCTIKITTLLLVFTLALSGYGLYWLAVRYSVGTFRHSLNHQEAHKDAIYQSVKKCNLILKKQFLISETNPAYIMSDLAETDFIYKYMVLDADILQSSECVLEVVNSLMKQPYKTQVIFLDKGKQVLSIDNINKRRN